MTQTYTFKLVVIFYVLLGSLGDQNVYAANESKAETKFNVEEIKVDFTQLYTELQLAHYDLFANLSKPEYDLAYSQYLKDIVEHMTLEQAQLHFQQFVALGNIAHANIELPIQAYIAFREEGGKALPLYINIAGDRVWVEDFYGGEQGINSYDEVIAINNKPIDEWLALFETYLSADNKRLANTLIERLFPFLIWLVEGEVSTFNITVKNDNRLDVVEVKTLTSQQQSESIAQQPVPESVDWQSMEAKMLENDIAYLRPGPFYNTEPNTENVWDNSAFTAFVDGAFMEFNQKDVKALIIDLRFNPGGTNSFSDHLIAWFATEPFKFASKFEVKVSPQAEDANAERLKLSTDQSDVSHQLAAFYAQNENGSVFTFDLPLSQPHKDKRFDKPVYVLVNRYSYSNAVSVAAIVQDYGFGKVVGETTADLATTYGAMEKFSLKNTGIEVGFPKALIVRPNGDKSPEGVTPDYHIPMAFESNAAQQQLIQTIHLIKEQLKGD